VCGVGVIEEFESGAKSNGIESRIANPRVVFAGIAVESDGCRVIYESQTRNPQETFINLNINE
jgi:hypothetical protein